MYELRNKWLRDLMKERRRKWVYKWENSYKNEELNKEINMYVIYRVDEWVNAPYGVSTNIT